MQSGEPELNIYAGLDYLYDKAGAFMTMEDRDLLCKFAQS